MTDSTIDAGELVPESSRPVPVRHPGRWVSGAVLLLLAAMLVHTILTNSRFEWHVVGHYLTAGPIVRGLLTTLELTLLAMVIGLALGAVLAVMRLSPNPIARGAAWLYIGFFRGTPVLVQIIFWFNLSALFPHITLGVPFGPQYLEVDVNQLVTPFVAALLGLGLNEGAYMAEIVRGGLISVSPGQQEAAAALGMSRVQTLRRVVFPQAMRVIIPATGNETIGMLKATAMVSVIAVSELLYSVQAIYSQSYQTIPLLIVASLWYLVVTTVLTVIQGFVERHYSRSANQGSRSSFGRRYLRNLNPLRAGRSQA